MNTQKETELKDFFKEKLDSFEKNINDKFADLNTEIQVIKTDLTWIKWLFGLFFSLIIVLLSTVLTVLFKLVG
ncbi:MAG: hypothetical protein QNJ18_17595 [Xenococcaceae cyanobacterium MO_167.B52]|nr:hypothetical protein [Xenococcaceae cyanobacterium MO_167.B52]